MLELGHGGTLLLEDVTALPAEIQGRLLGALQDRAVVRLGEDRRRSIDLRVVATTSRDLHREVAARRLRQDLYFHLNVFSVACTPLRDRPEDIPLIAAHSLKLICRRLNKKAPIVTQGTMRALARYRWPGNVRELETVIERGAILSNGGKLVVDLRGLAGSADGRLSASTVLTDAEVPRIEVANLIACLRQTEGKVSSPDGAAALLGLRPTTLSSRIKAYGITKDDWAGGG